MTPNKPTTLREEFEKWITKNELSITNHNSVILNKEVLIDFLTSHNKELISKIEGMKQPEGVRKTINEAFGGYNIALDEVINIIKHKNVDN